MLVLEVNVGDGCGDNVADLDNIGGLLHSVKTELADVNQTVQTGQDVDESAKAGSADNLCLDDGADRVVVLENPSCKREKCSSCPS